MRRKTTKKLLNSQLEAPPDNSRRVLIRKGPVSLETSLKELEENFARKQVKGDRGGRSAQHSCRGVQDDQPSKT